MKAYHPHQQRSASAEPPAPIKTDVMPARLPNKMLNNQDVLQMQRTLGNQATIQRLASIQRQETTDENQAAQAPFTDFDGKQYRISGREPNRKIEEVKRTVNEQGQVEYFAMGEVVDFQESRPIVEYYEEPRSLGDWFPRVTHVNGMMVKPQDGIQDAASFQAEINNVLQEEDAALGQDAVDVLYTYSATRGFGNDLLDAVKGKLYMSDDITAIQRQIMLDAVHNQQRVTVSAHSRGTIKTDNAVREAHSILTEELIPQIWEEVEAQINIPSWLRWMFSSTVRDIAEARAAEQMDQYIQLVYSGNAVEFPSTVLPIDFIVGSYDGVSMLVGSYLLTNHPESTMTHVWGGHGFRDTYVPTAARIIGQDIVQHR